MVVADCVGLVRNIDLRMHREIAKYKGFAGAVKGIECHETLPFLTTVGLDRFLRVHHLGTRKLVKKVYLKQQLISVLFSKEGLIQPLEPQPESKRPLTLVVPPFFLASLSSLLNSEETKAKTGKGKKGTDAEENEDELSEVEDEEQLWESILEAKDPGKKHKEEKKSSEKRSLGAEVQGADSQKKKQKKV